MKQELISRAWLAITHGPFEGDVLGRYLCRKASEGFETDG